MPSTIPSAYIKFPISSILKDPLCTSFKLFSSFPSWKSFHTHHFRVLISFHPSTRCNPRNFLQRSQPSSSNTTPLHSYQPRPSFILETVSFFGFWPSGPSGSPPTPSDINLFHVLQVGLPQQSSSFLHTFSQNLITAALTPPVTSKPTSPEASWTSPTPDTSHILSSTTHPKTHPVPVSPALTNGQQAGAILFHSTFDLSPGPGDSTFQISLESTSLRLHGCHPGSIFYFTPGQRPGPPLPAVVLPPDSCMPGLYLPLGPHLPPTPFSLPSNLLAFLLFPGHTKLVPIPQDPLEAFSPGSAVFKLFGLMTLLHS